MLQRASRRLLLASILFTVGVSAALAQAEKVRHAHRREISSRLVHVPAEQQDEMPLAEVAALASDARSRRPPVPTPSPRTAPVEPSIAAGRRRARLPLDAVPGHHEEGNAVFCRAQAGSSYCWQHAR